MICPKCRRETATITPRFICTECLIKEQRARIEELERVLRALQVNASNNGIGARSHAYDVIEAALNGGAR